MFFFLFVILFFSIIIEEKIEKTTGQNNYKITQKKYKGSKSIVIRL